MCHDTGPPRRRACAPGRPPSPSLAARTGETMSAIATSQARRLVRPARPPDTRLRADPVEYRTVPSVSLVEPEPNNAAATADVIHRLAHAQVIVSGDVNAVGDRDWFRLDLQAGDVVGAALKGQNS